MIGGNVENSVYYQGSGDRMPLFGETSLVNEPSQDSGLLHKSVHIGEAYFNDDIQIEFLTDSLSSIEESWSLFGLVGKSYDKCRILNDFILKLTSDSKEIDGDIIDLVNKNFWELLY